MTRRRGQAGTLTLPWPSSGGSTTTRASADGFVLAVAVVLALVGLVMVFSASAVVAGNRFHDSIYFLKRHLAWLAFGFLLLQAASRLDYTVWRKMALPILGLTVVLLILVLIPSLGVVVKGARRWLRLGPISVQPAEMVKLVVVLYLAAYLTRKEGRVTEFAAGFLPPLLIVGVLAGLVLLQPDLGTVVVIGLVTLGLLFLAGARLLHLFGLVPIVVPAVAVLIWKSPYRLQRLMTFLDPMKDPSGAGFQVNQSFLAFGSGGLFGVGLGEGEQKLFFLPEAHTDFVLALAGEELGLVGTSAIMVLFALLVLKGFQIASRAREPFGRHLALGITLLLGLQALINAGVVTGMLPTKGLTLPLVSYGGSSLMVNLLAIGILLSISRDRQGGGQSRGIGGR
ncbi:MAG: putative lipid II flippase FtsW [Nitrospirae bacterium]|nr:MAG: putative lipid II flippase FtsW [Nitrospirota bacterium]